MASAGRASPPRLGAHEAEPVSPPPAPPPPPPVHVVAARRRPNPLLTPLEPADARQLAESTQQHARGVAEAAIRALGALDASAAERQIYVALPPVHIPRVSEDTVHARFEFVHEIGEGATSTVWYAKKRREADGGAEGDGDGDGVEEEVAVKIIPSEKLQRHRTLAREIDILKSLSHPNIVKLHEVFRTDANLYLVMELVCGPPLFDAMVERKTFSELEAVAIVRELLSALAYMHARGISHRDIKPDNVLFTEDLSCVKLVDFGFARHFVGGVPGSGMSTPVGTLGFKAPEIILRGVHEQAVDLWSLGVLTYILLCGFPPFFSSRERADDPDFLFNRPFWFFFNKETPELLREILSGHHDFANKFWREISDHAKDFVSRLLTVDPHARMTAAEGLRHAWVSALRAPPLAQVAEVAPELHVSKSELIAKTSFALQKKTSIDLALMLRSSMEKSAAAAAAAGAAAAAADAPADAEAAADAAEVAAIDAAFSGALRAAAPAISLAPPLLPPVKSVVAHRMRRMKPRSLRSMPDLLGDLDDDEGDAAAARAGPRLQPPLPVPVVPVPVPTPAAAAPVPLHGDWLDLFSFGRYVTRWISVLPGALQIWKHPDDALSRQPFGCLHLANVEVSVVDAENATFEIAHRDGAFVFHLDASPTGIVHFGESSARLRSYSTSDMERWVRLVRQAAELPHTHLADDTFPGYFESPL